METTTTNGFASAVQVPPRHEHDYDPESGCFLCQSKKPFDLPDRLVADCLAGRLVIFAGAGISTENRHVMPHTLYEDVAVSVGTDPHKGPSFPALMSRFEDVHDRSTLLQKIKSRFDYIDSFPQIQHLATRFHSELSTLFPITEIVTTNWDIYFERLCGAIPIVEPDDYAFWTMPGRKVFKIHGSMNNVGSLVATEQDYEECYERLRTGLIGASLKHMLATKTLVFFGYSFRDEDFNKIYSYLHDEMGRILPRSFIVTLDEDFDAAAYPASTVIQTDGAHFLSVLKSRLLETPHFLDDERFSAVPEALDAALGAHDKVIEAFAPTKHPDVIYTCSYQDGMIDAFQRMLSRKRTGEYSHVCDVEQKISSYFELRKRNLRAKKYEDVAYIEGYKNGLIYLLSDDPVRDALPLYFLFGDEDIDTFADFKRALKKAPDLHKAAHARALKIAARLSSDDLVFQHPPFFSFEP
jgi:NAD-dependent SIR2 family protein deacetylase